MTWIQTFSGKKFSLIDPQPEDVDIGDIVAALCKLVRFTGHCRGMYTVAQHSVHVADLVPSELCYAALLHDAPEAYYGDFSRPLKQAANLISRGHFSQMLHRIDVVVFDALGIADFDDPQIHLADNRMLATEARDLMVIPPEPWAALPPPREETICVWEPQQVHNEFVRAYRAYKP